MSGTGGTPFKLISYQKMKIFDLFNVISVILKLIEAFKVRKKIGNLTKIILKFCRKIDPAQPCTVILSEFLYLYPQHGIEGSVLLTYATEYDSETSKCPGCQL